MLSPERCQVSRSDPEIRRCAGDRALAIRTVVVARLARTSEGDRAMRKARKKAPAPSDGTEQDQGITLHETYDGSSAAHRALVPSAALSCCTRRRSR